MNIDDLKCPRVSESNAVAKQALASLDGRRQLVDALEQYIRAACREHHLPEPPASQVRLAGEEPPVVVLGVPLHPADCDDPHRSVAQIVWERYREAYGPPKPPPPATLVTMGLMLIVPKDSPLLTRLSAVLAEQKPGEGFAVITPQYQCDFTYGARPSEASLLWLMRKVLADLQSEVDHAATHPQEVSGWVEQTQPGTLAISPCFVKAKICLDGFAGHTAETVVDMRQVVSIQTHTECLDDLPPVELLFSNGATLRVYGPKELWVQRFTDVQKWAKREGNGSVLR